MTPPSVQCCSTIDMGSDACSTALPAQLLDEEYLDRYYKRKASTGRSFHDLQLECMADGELSPFESRSLDMRVLTGQTSLFYKASHCSDMLSLVRWL